MYQHQPPYGDTRFLNFPWLAGPPSDEPPGQMGGGPPFGGFPGLPDGQGQISAPTSPPPSFTPQQPQTQQAQGEFGVFAVDPGAIQGCLFRFTYIWLRWESFWFFPVFIGRRSIAGFRWQQNRWVYYGVDLDQIQSFQCY